MRKTKVKNSSAIKQNDSYEGISIEKKIELVTTTNEPIDESAPIVYTERKDGVRPEYDVRTDRFDVAMEAMDTVQKSHLAKRDHKPTSEPKSNDKDGGDVDGAA